MPPPLHSHHHPHINHHLNIKLVSHLLEDTAVLCRQCQPPPPPHPQPEPLTRLTAFVLGIKYEADECVCGANYDIALRCQNILRTTFLHAGP